MKAELVEVESKLADYQKILAEFNRQFKEHQILQEKKEYLLSRLYTKEDIIKLFDDLNAKSKYYNVRVVEFSPSVEELIELNKQLVASDQPTHLDIIIKMRGQMPNVGKFIGDIETQNYYKGFNSCHVSNTNELNPLSDVKYSFKAILGTLKDS
jgi:hypothetical protein